MASAPVALTINMHDIAKASLPADLEARLTGSPPKSPEALAQEIQAHTQRTRALRAAHLDAVKDRASRESQRAADANARKLRIAANRVEKVQARLDAAALKMGVKKESIEADREARKARRIALADAVTAARQAADEAKEVRAQALLSAEQQAQAKHAKALGDVKDKAMLSVKHAIAVAAAHKEKEALTSAAIAEKLSARHQAAESRRDDHNSPAGSPTKGMAPKVRRVLNEGKLASEMKRLVHEASLAKAAEKRAAHIAGVKARATSVTAKAAAVAAQHKAKTEGTDEATAGARAALYERMVRAETARLFSLKAKYAPKASKADAAGAAASVVVVSLHDVITPRAPPAPLALRLASVSRTLVASSAARQRAAAARRAALRLTTLLKAAKAAERRAAALATLAKRGALAEARVSGKARRAATIHAIALGRRAHVVARAHERTHAAALARQAIAAALRAASAASAAKCSAASDRRDAKTRAVAKAGVVAVRAAANKTRRAAAENARGDRAAALTGRCALATAKRAALLAERVEVAKKRQAARHPRREMPDEEVKQAYSDA